jgi:hypothetical protein
MKEVGGHLPAHLFTIGKNRLQMHWLPDWTRFNIGRF